MIKTGRLVRTLSNNLIALEGYYQAWLKAKKPLTVACVNDVQALQACCANIDRKLVNHAFTVGDKSRMTMLSVKETLLRDFDPSKAPQESQPASIDPTPVLIEERTNLILSHQTRAPLPATQSAERWLR